MTPSNENVPLDKLAELYGVVVTPEEARRFYRREAWLRVATVWGMVLLMVGALLILRFA
jgi:hypothetical protein